MSKVSVGEKRLIEDIVVNFNSGNKEYISLSNFWECEVVVRWKWMWSSCIREWRALFSRGEVYP